MDQSKNQRDQGAVKMRHLIQNRKWVTRTVPEQKCRIFSNVLLGEQLSTSVKQNTTWQRNAPQRFLCKLMHSGKKNTHAWTEPTDFFIKISKFKISDESKSVVVLPQYSTSPVNKPLELENGFCVCKLSHYDTSFFNFFTRNLLRKPNDDKERRCIMLINLPAKSTIQTCDYRADWKVSTLRKNVHLHISNEKIHIKYFCAIHNADYWL